MGLCFGCFAYCSIELGLRLPLVAGYGAFGVHKKSLDLLRYHHHRSIDGDETNAQQLTFGWMRLPVGVFYERPEVHFDAFALSGRVRGTKARLPTQVAGHPALNHFASA